MQVKVWSALWIVASILLFLYSFTQVDLGLTLTRASFFRDIQTAFQYIGYFNRPLSTSLFLGLLVLLFTLYIWTMRLVQSNKLSAKSIWRVILISTAILCFSYNAFSYDIFNYIFDAKIVTQYQQNPYEHKALDYPADPMLSFMHWTHRTYPYGPGWLLVTIPLSYVGLNYFLITFFLFKLLAAAAFLGTAYFVEKVVRANKASHSLFALAFFAFNPLVIIESLVSAHNDIVMIFFSTLAIYLLLQKKICLSGLALALSISIKFITAFLIPGFAALFFFKRINKEFVFHMMLWSMTVPIIIASLRTTFQPWYFLYFLSIAAFIPHKFYVILISVILSFVFLLEYAFYLYMGMYTLESESFIAALDIVGIIVAIISIVCYFSYKRNNILIEKKNT